MRPARALAAALLGVALVSAACGREGAGRPPGPVVYAALGDSAGFGIGGDPPWGDGGYPRRIADRLRARGLQVTLHNLSIPGARAADLADVQVPRALAISGVTLVTVCIGGNDVGGPVTPEQFGAQIDAILARLAPLGAPVVVCNVPDLSLTPEHAGEPPSYRERIVAMNAALATAVSARGAALVDLFAATPSGAARPDLYFADGFHPSAAGYEVWTDAMMPAVLAAVPGAQGAR